MHILVNNTAGPPAARRTAPTSPRTWRSFQQHLVANQILLQAVLPGMRAANWGRIVNIISTSVKEPIANLGVSNTIRGAVASWAKTLSSELGGFGITVNNVLPGYTRTQRLDQIVRERAAATGKPEAEIANGDAGDGAGRALCARRRKSPPRSPSCARRRRATSTAINLPVDGGRTRSL